MNRESVDAVEEATGIRRATGRPRKILDGLQALTAKYLEVLALEKSGIRDGDGFWHGSDVVYGMAQEIERGADAYYDALGEQEDRRRKHDSHFGECPECGRNDGYLNAGRTHVFFCDEHKTRWTVGSNLFSSWRDETEEEQREAWDSRGLEFYREVEPVHDYATIERLREENPRPEPAA